MSQATDTTPERFVIHLLQGFTPELARHFAELPQPTAEFQMRLDELADKANEGTLSADEAREYDTYIELMYFIALMRLKARASVSHFLFSFSLFSRGNEDCRLKRGGKRRKG